MAEGEEEMEEERTLCAVLLFEMMLGSGLITVLDVGFGLEASAVVRKREFRGPGTMPISAIGSERGG